MRTPASPPRVLAVAGYSVCIVWTGAGALIVLHSPGAMLLAERHLSGPPDWIVALADVLSTHAVIVVRVQHRRGELDEYDNRRR